MYNIHAQEFSKEPGSNLEYVKYAVDELGNGNEVPIDKYIEWHREAFPNDYLFVGDQVYAKVNLGISNKALMKNYQTYRAGDADWVTYEFQQGRTHISITLDRKQYNVISKFTSTDE